MSEVNAGRLLMLIFKVISPAASFETTIVVMSGAFGSSPASGRLPFSFDAGIPLPFRNPSGTLWFVLPRGACVPRL
jgi:hypothetical protein